jgi:hypothetical protein
MQTRILNTVFVIAFLSLNVHGQSTEERVASFFKTDEPMSSFKFFRGRMNDVNDIVIALGANGKQYKGIMKYLRSNEELMVEGIVNGQELRLAEMDSIGKITGFILGTIDDFDGITAEWYNHDRSIGGDLQLIPYAQEPRYPTYCGDNKWIRTYDGRIGEETVDFIIKRGTGFRVDGLAYFKSQNKTYHVAGELTNYNRDIKLHFQDNEWQSLGTLEGKVDFKTDNITCSFTYNDGKLSEGALTKSQVIDVGCIEYADFISTMEIIYPKTRNFKFNDALNTYIQDWLKTSREYTNQYKAQMKVLKPNMRASLRSYLWCDIDYFSNTLISGKVIHTNTWENGYTSYTFNFDFENNKMVALSEIFKSGSGYETFIRKYIEEAMKKRPFSDDVIFQKWIEKAKFDYFTIRKEGINFISDYNAIYGEQHCTIPYEVLKPYLNKDSLVTYRLE